MGRKQKAKQCGRAAFHYTYRKSEGEFDIQVSNRKEYNFVLKKINFYHLLYVYITLFIIYNNTGDFIVIIIYIYRTHVDTDHYFVSVSSTIDVGPRR